MALTRRGFRPHRRHRRGRRADQLLHRRARAARTCSGPLVEPTLQAVEPRRHRAQQQREPDGPRRDGASMRSERHLARAAARPGRYSGSSRDLIDALAKKHGVKPENIVLGCGSTQILRIVDARLHRERQTARRAPSRPTRSAPTTPS